MKHLVVIIYDSLTNATLDEQLMHPLLSRLDHEPRLHATIISYERNVKNAALAIQKYQHQRLSIHLLPQAPFIGTASLWYAAWHLTKLLPTALPYELIARGPIAGWISLKAYTPLLCTKITIQAHALHATSLTHDQQKTHLLRTLWHQYQTRCFQNIERTVYSNPAPLIEVQNIAARNALHEQYGTRLERISIAPYNALHPISEPADVNVKEL